MARWKKQPAYTGPIHHGCLNCGGTATVARMDTIVAVGFGYAAITRDGVEVFREQPHHKRLRRLRSFERRAAADPRHDWRLILEGPLRGREYQRHGEKRWVLIASTPGFA